MGMYGGICNHVTLCDYLPTYLHLTLATSLVEKCISSIKNIIQLASRVKITYPFFLGLSSMDMIFVGELLLCTVRTRTMPQLPTIRHIRTFPH